MPGPAERVFLSLGGNIGEPARAFASALTMLDADAETRVERVSSLYRTPPWGKTDQPDFINAAAELTTTRQPADFLDLCIRSERALKRVRAERWGPRLIDLDILAFGDRVVHVPGLDIPHPRMFDRAFVLVPLNEIAPGLMVAGIAIAERLRQVDRAGIERLPGGRNWWRRRSATSTDRPS
ncbi:MAG: 2-amino-4-hydroxy-6-hydroxymethyldihydropteridine diphosphokinase [Rhizobiaceae bacterium]|nr:2-amino-4-hydroxy-6-hydroxymethyldihydropteridine diphosphokinase [Rhizobiaceae bacterium]